MKQQLNTNAAPTTVEMVEQDLQQPDRRMQWWYRLAAPPLPASTESFATREAYRRGKLISIALLMQLTIVIVLLPTVGIFVNHALIPNLAIMVLLLSIAIFLNRKGWVIPAGVLAVAGLDLSLMLDLLSYPMLSSFLLPLLDLLVLPELFAVSLLPPRAVFLDAALHICFIIAALTFLPQNTEIKLLLHSSAFQDALARPLVLQILVAVITYLWVRSATQAIERADRATSIAMLERDMAEQGVRVTEEKQQLENSIQQIVSVHAQAANGNYAARVSLTEGNPLWAVAGSLNNLLSRVQRYRHDSHLLAQTNEALHRFFQERNRVGNGFIAWDKTNTPVDVLIQQHNGLTESSQIQHPFQSESYPSL